MICSNLHRFWTKEIFLYKARKHLETRHHFALLPPSPLPWRLVSSWWSWGCSVKGLCPRSNRRLHTPVSFCLPQRLWLSKCDTNTRIAQARICTRSHRHPPPPPPPAGDKSHWSPNCAAGFSVPRTRSASALATHQLLLQQPVNLLFQNLQQLRLHRVLKVPPVLKSMQLHPQLIRY